MKEKMRGREETPKCSWTAPLDRFHLPSPFALPKVRVRGFDRLFRRLEGVLGVHGETCQKAPHVNPEGGYLHAADDDRPYDVDGVKYCGRCHWVMS